MTQIKATRLWRTVRAIGALLMFRLNVKVVKRRIVFQFQDTFKSAKDRAVSDYSGRQFQDKITLASSLNLT